MNHLRLGKHHDRIHALTLLATVMISGLAVSSSGLLGRTFAYTNHNPIGVIDYCVLSGNATTIYGWAHDPDSIPGGYPRVTISVGGVAQTVKTDIVGYHDGAINAYLTRVRPGIPQSHTYGFQATYYNQYKGIGYGVSATGINDGSGTSNIALAMDTTSNLVDNIENTSKFTPGGYLPDACLVAVPPTAPAPTPAPAASPAPVPAPAPAPTPTSSSSPTTSSPKPTTATTATPSSSIVTNSTAKPPSASTKPATTPSLTVPPGATNTGKADASVQTGTLSASVTVPADGARSAYVRYGTTPDKLGSSTADTPMSGDKLTFAITDLQPKTKYYFQIVRTASTGATTSPAATFDTAGYAVVLHFIDNAKRAIVSVGGIIDNTDATEAKSDANGDLQFYDLAAGTYTVKYAYQGKTYSKEFDTSSAASDIDAGKTVVLSDTVNVSTLKNGSSAPLASKKHSVTGKVVLVMVLLLAAGGVIGWFWLRRRRQATYNAYTATPYAGAGPGAIDMPTALAPTMVAPRPEPVPAPLPAPRKLSKTKTPTPGEPLEHVGESLREMVVRSMHEEAQKRKHNQ